MDTSLLKTRIKKLLNEALTPDQVSKVEDKYNSIYSGMLKGNKKKLMKYIDPKFNRPNPDAMAMGRAINLVKKDSDKEEVNEAKYPEYIVTKDDWKKSKFPFEKLKNSEFKIIIAGEGDDRKYMFFWKEDGEGDWEAGNMKRQLRSALTAIAKRKLPIKEEVNENEAAFEHNKARAGRIMKDLFGPDFEFDYTYKLEGDRIIIHPEGYNDDGTLFDMKDVHKEKIIRTFQDKMPSADVKPNMGGGITVHLKESINENEMDIKVPFVIDLGENISRANYHKVMLKLDSMGYKWYQLAMNVRDKLLVNRLGRKPIIHFYPGFRYLILGPIGEIPEKEINHNNELIGKYSSLNVVPFEDFLNESLRREKGLVKETSWDEIAMENYGVSYDELNYLEQEWVRDKMDRDRGVMEEVNEGWLERAIEDEKDPKKLAKLKAKKEFFDNTPKEKRRKMSDDEIRNQINKLVREVYSEKQRRWACAQDDPKFDEMCKDTAISKKKIKEYFMLMNPSRKRGGGRNYPSEYLDVLAHYQHSVLKIPRHKRAKATVGADMHDRYGREVWDIISNNYPSLGLDSNPPSDWKDTARLLASKFKEADLSYYRDLKKPFLNEKYSIMEKEDLTKSEKKKLKKVSSQLKKSVKAHDKQSKIIDKALKETGMDKAKKNMDNYKKQNRLTELIKDALKNPKKADLNKDGKLSDYEKKRGAAIEKSMQKESYMMSVDSNVNSAVLQALSVLKHANIDGETMQYILEELGMDEQMWKQLNVKYGTP